MTLQDMHDSGVNEIHTSSPYTKMADIQISAKGIESLLKKLNPHKASGPDQINQVCFEPSIKNWLPSSKCFSKDPLTRPNYQVYGRKQMYPQYLKRVTKLIPQITALFPSHKVLEHIVASNISKHFTNQNIHYNLQHGFREKRSCETQLIMLIDELSKYMQSRKQTDLILLDFNKVVDKVAHEKF